MAAREWLRHAGLLPSSTPANLFKGRRDRVPEHKGEEGPESGAQSLPKQPLTPNIGGFQMDFTRYRVFLIDSLYQAPMSADILLTQ